ncbi:uncharacterized protein LOC106168707 [Lingula anatina]|uniref:Uncharacterized protein LOC106168707 n=1 Tax=Lingula anatina TaxID=7574 RepID=A0A1S3IZA5_LINAN|nr:uncharacterized protein LOC106168707 [Lingula anatina]|eukprot:XP_013403321.1 uncharacterized protein LOC106168707 [Lingula anatina]
MLKNYSKSTGSQKISFSEQKSAYELIQSQKLFKCFLDLKKDCQAQIKKLELDKSMLLDSLRREEQMFKKRRSKYDKTSVKTPEMSKFKRMSSNTRCISAPVRENAVKDLTTYAAGKRLIKHDTTERFDKESASIKREHTLSPITGTGALRTSDESDYSQSGDGPSLDHSDTRDTRMLSRDLKTDVRCLPETDTFSIPNTRGLLSRRSPDAKLVRSFTWRHTNGSKQVVREQVESLKTHPQLLITPTRTSGNCAALNTAGDNEKDKDVLSLVRKHRRSKSASLVSATRTPDTHLTAQLLPARVPPKSAQAFHHTRPARVHDKNWGAAMREDLLLKVKLENIALREKVQNFVDRQAQRVADGAQQLEGDDKRPTAKKPADSKQETKNFSSFLTFTFDD